MMAYATELKVEGGTERSRQYQFPLIMEGPLDAHMHRCRPKGNVKIKKSKNVPNVQNVKKCQKYKNVKK